MLSRLGKFAFFVPREGNWDVLEHNLLIKDISRSRASITIISLAFETRFAPKFHRSNGSRSRSSRITNKLINSYKLSSILAFSSEEVCFVEFLSFRRLHQQFWKIEFCCASSKYFEYFTSLYCSWRTIKVREDALLWLPWRCDKNF